MSDTQFLATRDGLRIAYNVYGEGPALLLIHGFRTDRSIWTKFGWVDRLASKYKLIALDLRGRGESTAPTDPDCYTLSDYLADLNAVIAAVGVEQFYVFGHSFGAALTLRLAASSDRVLKVIGAGTTFGAGNTPESIAKQVAEIETWAWAKAEATLDAFPADIRNFAAQNDLEVYKARVKALVGWPPIEPTNVHPQALLYSGTQDGSIYTTLQSQRDSIEGAGHQLNIFDDLTHLELVSKIEVVAPTVEAFLQA